MRGAVDADGERPSGTTNWALTSPAAMTASFYSALDFKDSAWDGRPRCWEHYVGKIYEHGGTRETIRHPAPPSLTSVERTKIAMSLKPCGECGSEISDKAPSCPRCGAPASLGSRPASPQPPPKRTGVVRQVIGLMVLIGLWVVGYRVFSGQGIKSAVSGPQTVWDETITLHEGQAKSYGFTLPASRRVDVAISASPHKVNVMLMNDDEWKKYAEVKGNLFGGQFTYEQALSRQSVMSMNETSVLEAGKWRIVVERPNESLLVGDDTNATVKVLAY